MRTEDDTEVQWWEHLDVTCFPAALPARSGQVADERIAKAFKVTKFAAPVPEWDPPRTDPLVNKPVYFMTGFAQEGYEPYELRAVAPEEMLGHDLQIMPELKSVTYDFGDGTTKGPTTDTGNTYPDGEITHTYTSTDPVKPRITAIYTGRYQLDGGEWHPLGLEVEVEGEPLTLTPSELTTELVAPPE
ncbi:hypothetical protein [Kytococcus sp. Marseille-QA3725]